MKRGPPGTRGLQILTVAVVVEPGARPKLPPIQGVLFAPGELLTAENPRIRSVQAVEEARREGERVRGGKRRAAASVRSGMIEDLRRRLTEVDVDSLDGAEARTIQDPMRTLNERVGVARDDRTPRAERPRG